jgi:hypothetical protein
MKTLNDILREEFTGILGEDEFVEMIARNKLDAEIIKEAFDVLLEFKHQAVPDRGKTEFENYIINTIKSDK